VFASSDEYLPNTIDLFQSVLHSQRLRLQRECIGFDVVGEKMARLNARLVVVQEWYERSDVAL